MKKLNLKFTYNSTKKRFYASSDNELYVLNELPDTLDDVNWKALPDNGSGKTTFVERGEVFERQIDTTKLSGYQEDKSDELPEDILKGLGL